MYLISKSPAKAEKKKARKQRIQKKKVNSQEKSKDRRREESYITSFRKRRGTQREVLRYRGDYCCLRNISPKDNIYNPIRSCPRSHSKKV